MVLESDDAGLDVTTLTLFTIFITGYWMNKSKTLQDNIVDEDDNEHLLKNIFNSFITCDEEFIKEQLAIMIARLKKDNNKDDHLISLIIRLYDQYPSDVGVFSPLLMNHIILQKGQSFFIGANELHAYISGKIVI